MPTRNPKLVVQWLRPRELTMRHSTAWTFAMAVGGAMSTPTLRGTTGSGVFRSAASLDGLVQTFVFEGATGHVSLETTTFEASCFARRQALTF